MSAQKILIADDEKDILDLLEYNLEKAGYEILRANNGSEVLELVKDHNPDLFLLDIGMPDIDGIQLCYQLRDMAPHQSSVIAFLTAKLEEYVEVAAFEAGADDFILKPIKPRALIARIATLIKRFNENLPSQSDLEIFDLKISPDSYTVTQAGEEISLSKLEFDLLYFMASHPGKVFNRSQLLSSVWDNTIVLQRTVDVHIRKLRKLLGNGYIDTVKGVGYKFVTAR
ncbi:MAG: response regulator transcription factor [Bacteroidota bacterium]